MSFTPFERNIVPSLSEWLHSMLLREPPDVLIPVERKGTHLLHALESHLHERLGARTRTQTLYERALHFQESANLSQKNVIVFDDATFSGRTLNRYRALLEHCGNPRVKLLACIGLSRQENALQSQRPPIECFLRVDTHLYHEYSWQIAELIIDKSLQTGVNHHGISLRFSTPVASVWDTIIDRLRSEGVCDIPPTSAEYPLLQAVLHQPGFASSSPFFSPEGLINISGLVGLRLIADSSGNMIQICPKVTATLEIPAQGRVPLTLEDCKRLYEKWANDSKVGGFLLEEANPQADPARILYFAVGLDYEVAVALRIAAIVRECLPPSIEIRALTSRQHLGRLYGVQLGSRVGSLIEHAIGSGIATARRISSESSQTHSRPYQDTALRSGVMVRSSTAGQLNELVRQGTTELERLLKSAYHERNKGRPSQDWESVGMTFEELEKDDLFSSRPDSALLVNRCLEFAARHTSIVPFIDIQEDTDNSRVLVTSKYRTAEVVRGGGGTIEDYQTYSREIAGETVATAIHFLRRRSRRWRGQPVPKFVLNKILTVLYHSSSEMKRTPLKPNPAEHGPEMTIELPAFIGPATRTPLINFRSEHFQVTPEGRFEVSESFRAAYQGGSLRLAARQELGSIEAYLTSLVDALDGADNVSDLLLCWSLVANRKAGLDYVMRDVELALVELSNPLEVISSGRGLKKSRLTESVKRARHFLGVAVHEKIDKLKTDWSQPLRSRWGQPISVEAQLSASLLEPVSEKGIYDLAVCFCEVCKRFADLVDRLGSEGKLLEQQDLFSISDSAQHLARGVAVKMEELEYVLRGRRTPRSSDVHLPENSPDREIEVGRRLKMGLATLRSFSAAFAWIYSRPIGVDRRADDENKPRRRVILFVDVAGSTPFSLTHPHEENTRWKDEGLNLVSQWGSAFGGEENPNVYHRHGDDIVIEFVDSDSAVICAAVILEHIVALAATGEENLTYNLHMAVDSFLVSDGDGENTISLAIDRSAKLSKGAGKRGQAEGIWLTPEVVEELSAEIRETVSADPEGELDLGAETSKGRFVPQLASRDRLLEIYRRRIDAWIQEATEGNGES